MDLFSSFLTGQGIGLVLFLFYALIFIFLGGGLFFLLIRPIVLWYFKVKSIDQRLEENNRLQSQILEQLKTLNYRKSIDEEVEEPKKDYSSYMPK